MSLDANNLVRLIKRAAVDAVNATSPFAVKIGEVTSVNPLKININQKITIPAAQLMLTNSVRDYTVHMTVDHSTEPASSDENDLTLHSHKYAGKKSYTVHLGLNVGEKVLLLRCDGGQKFIVLDRLEVPK